MIAEIVRRYLYLRIVQAARSLLGLRVHYRQRYGEYLTGPRWFVIRNLRCWWDGWSCTQCGKRYPLEVHHLTYQNKGKGGLPGMLWEFIDCRTLCDKCHEERHEGT